MVNKLHQYQQNEQLPVTSQFKPLNTHTHTPYMAYIINSTINNMIKFTSNDYYCFFLISK